MRPPGGPKERLCVRAAPAVSRNGLIGIQGREMRLAAPGGLG